jgi:hypothetical protein
MYASGVRVFSSGLSVWQMLKRIKVLPRAQWAEFLNYLSMADGLIGIL